MQKVSLGFSPETQDKQKFILPVYILMYLWL